MMDPRGKKPEQILATQSTAIPNSTLFTSSQFGYSHAPSIPHIRVTPPSHNVTLPTSTTKLTASPLAALSGNTQMAIEASQPRSPVAYVFSPTGRVEQTLRAADSESGHQVFASGIEPPPQHHQQVPLSYNPALALQTVGGHPAASQMLPYQSAQYGGYTSYGASGLQPMVYPVAGPTQLIYDIYDVEDMVPYQPEYWRPVAFHYRSCE
eukprot:Protomagalhaensia_wolfi_Nauph_80__1421@NODE_1852_length_1308_cov_87_141056_g1445_i0_p1_GENE_NODE_1852_length_1308_cov_87_141056_g1445_i0NODE_1852_length_1308_cov_87_141056_g1445_i0_p1_ORF_typecomplete_len209_score22_48_NODE_1852_length_1308_cov_87_141056_g1445_i068694